MFPHTVTIKTQTSSDKFDKPTYSSTSYYARVLSSNIEIYNGSIRTVENNERCVFLEPDASVTTSDALTYDGRDYEILSVEPCLDQRNERHQWQLVIR